MKDTVKTVATGHTNWETECRAFSGDSEDGCETGPLETTCQNDRPKAAKGVGPEKMECTKLLVRSCDRAVCSLY